MRFEYFRVRLSHTLKNMIMRFPVLILLCGGLCYDTGFAADPGTEKAGPDYTTANGTLNWRNGEASDKSLTDDQTPPSLVHYVSFSGLSTAGFSYFVRTNIVATPSINSETDKTAVGSGPWFYRVEVE